ncbi:MAG TPA: histidine kinase [Thermoanaerobaculia bacterium]|nr:histidine kinase [Thermoanaerobaculia bacterium]
MHPIISDRRRLLLYLTLWVLLTMLLVAGLAPDVRSIGLVAAVVLPPAVLYAFVCLAAWYPVRALPPRRTHPLRIVMTHGVAALVAASLWLVLLRGGIRLFDAFLGPGPATSALAERQAILLATGVVLYLLSVAFHYLILAIDLARSLETRELELQLLARDAELNSLKAQINPHFLFNSLHSISSLTASDPAAARDMAIQLAGYLRSTLKAARHDTIPLADELALALTYLGIERQRFGDRLRVEQNVDAAIATTLLPPLVLQPLVENAVTHGISNLIEPGTIRISARPDGGFVSLVVENDCDPDRPKGHGEGIGLQNVRRRIGAHYGGESRVAARDEGNRFVVEVRIPR